MAGPAILRIAPPRGEFRDGGTNAGTRLLVPIVCVEAVFC